MPGIGKTTWKQRRKIAKESLDRRLRCPVGAIYLKTGQTEASAKTERDEKLKKQFRSANKKDFADNLRRHMTASEKRLWKHLKADRHWKAQQIVSGYIPDFIYPKKRLLVEVDGPIHDTRRAKDRIRDGHLNASGYYVLRFTNRQVKDDLGSVLKTISKFTGVEQIRLAPSDQA